MVNLSYVTYTGDNVTNTFSIGAINYLAEAHLKASLDGIVTTAFTFSAPNIVFTTPPGTGVIIKLYRDTPRTLTGRLVDFTTASVLSEDDLDTSAIQLLYIAQEAYERGGESGLVYLTYSDSLLAFDADTNKIVNVTDPTSDQDAATKAYVDTASSDHMGKSGGKWAGESLIISNVVDPTSAQDAATKKYVDDIAAFGGAGQSQSTSFTLTTGTNTYTLVDMINADQDMLVVAIEGVLQIPSVDFTVTSASPDSYIVFLKALVTSEVASVQNFGKKVFVAADGIVDGTITTAKLATESVTNAKMAPDSVESDQIATDAITTAKIIDNAVTTSKIVDNSITLAKMADDSVGSAELVDGSVINVALGSEAVDWPKMKGAGFTTIGAPTTTDLYLTVNKTTGELTLSVIGYNDLTNITTYPSTVAINKFATAAADVQISPSLTHPAYKITGVSTPTANYDAATKKYVDDSVGTNYKGGRLLTTVTLGAAASTLVAESFHDTGQYVRYEVVFNSLLCQTAETTTIKCRLKKQSTGAWMTSYNWSTDSVTISPTASSTIVGAYSEAKATIGSVVSNTLPAVGRFDVHQPLLGNTTLMACGEVMYVTTKTNLQFTSDALTGVMDGVELSLGSGNNFVAGATIMIYGYEV